MDVQYRGKRGGLRYMVTIALIILIPIIAIIVGYFTLKAYSTGLKHSYELKHDTIPTEKKNVIQSIIDKREAIKEEEQAKEDANIMSEWLHGKKED